MSHKFKRGDRVVCMETFPSIYLKRATVRYSGFNQQVVVLFDDKELGEWNILSNHLRLENDPSLADLLFKIEDQKRRQEHAMRYL